MANLKAVREALRYNISAHKGIGPGSMLTLAPYKTNTRHVYESPRLSDFFAISIHLSNRFSL